jgi:hypothetical protein
VTGGVSNEGLCQYDPSVCSCDRAPLYTTSDIVAAKHLRDVETAKMLNEITTKPFPFVFRTCEVSCPADGLRNVVLPLNQMLNNESLSRVFHLYRVLRLHEATDSKVLVVAVLRKVMSFLEAVCVEDDWEPANKCLAAHIPSLRLLLSDLLDVLTFAPGCLRPVDDVVPCSAADVAAVIARRQANVPFKTDVEVDLVVTVATDATDAADDGEYARAHPASSVAARVSAAYVAFLDCHEVLLILNRIVCALENQGSEEWGRVFSRDVPGALCVVRDIFTVTRRMFGGDMVLVKMLSAGAVIECGLRTVQKVYEELTTKPHGDVWLTVLQEAWVTASHLTASWWAAGKQPKLEHGDDCFGAFLARSTIEFNLREFAEATNKWLGGSASSLHQLVKACMYLNVNGCCARCPHCAD